jgi:D-tagatose-1,6-bisphosphate aldolase subunit GatZ/KbaZ
VDIMMLSGEALQPTTSVKDLNPVDTTMPAIKGMIQRVMTDFTNRVTLLAVCPNSEAVARAALTASKEANAPILFAATLNQVDTDRGYTGWTPQSFTEFVEVEAQKIGLTSPVLTCLDHGGPWLKDRHTLDGLSFQETMDATKKSLEACLDAGYALLHIDPTVDRTLPPDTNVPIDLVVERTLDMIRHAEAYRSARGYAAVSYEVGTEEVHGGLADDRAFSRFLTGLDDGLTQMGLEHAWPAFVVGKVGTDLHTTYFDPDVARSLTEKVRPYGALIKGHYSDYVDNPEDYPLSGMGGANVGPEFTEEEYYALSELVALETKVGRDSGFAEALRNAVIASGRWKKWLSADERGRDFDQLTEGRQGWLIRTGSRYIWTADEVLEARARLYANLSDVRDADAFVIWRIRRSILKYFHAFNLINFNDRLIGA